MAASSPFRPALIRRGSSCPELAVRLLVLAATLCFVTAPASAQVFIEDFDDNSIDSSLWSVDLYGAGSQVAERNHRLEFEFPGSASGTEFGARLVSTFRLRGDFDIRVDYRLLEWPAYNGIRIAAALTDDYFDDYGMERSSLSAIEPLGEHEVYVADFGPFVLVETTDVSGTLRLVRSGATQTGCFASGGGWTPVLTDAAPTRDITIQLHAWSHDYAFRDIVVCASFDNFTVVSGELVWDPTPIEQTTWGSIKCLFR